jgi:hypothetical protein
MGLAEKILGRTRITSRTRMPPLFECLLDTVIPWIAALTYLSWCLHWTGLTPKILSIYLNFTFLFCIDAQVT